MPVVECRNVESNIFEYYVQNTATIHTSFVRNLDLAVVDGVNDIVWWFAVYCAANRLRGPQNLLCNS